MPMGKTRYNILPVGQHGNLSKVDMMADDIVSAVIGTEWELGELQAGTTVFGGDLIHDAMGTDVTISLGYKYKNSAHGSAAPAGIRALTAAASAVNTSFNLAAPLVLEHDVIITATIGGATTDAGPNTLRFRPEFTFTDV